MGLARPDNEGAKHAIERLTRFRDQLTLRLLLRRLVGQLRLILLDLRRAFVDDILFERIVEI